MTLASNAAKRLALKYNVGMPQEENAKFLHSIKLLSTWKTFVSPMF
jgi:hypothetical protein